MVTLLTYAAVPTGIVFWTKNLTVVAVVGADVQARIVNGLLGYKRQ